MSEKYCKRCLTTKPITEFRFRDQTKQGKGKYYYHMCKECERAEKRTPMAKIARYRCSDKAKSLITDVDSEWYEIHIQCAECTYCGMTDDSMVADRVDNSKGHTKDNCIPACPLCNAVRGDRLTVDEMKVIGKAIREVKLSRKK